MTTKYIASFFLPLLPTPLPLLPLGLLVALAAVAFASWGTLICWLALIIGTVLLVIDSMSGSSRWGLSMGGLAFFTLITLLNV